MCSLRVCGQIFLPIFLSAFLIQLLISFSENGYSQVSRHRGKLRPKSTDDDGCSLKKNCQMCIEDRNCFWCSEEQACKIFCLSCLGCQLSSVFWLSCKVDMFGFLLLLLLAILLIAFIWHCCIFQYYVQGVQRIDNEKRNLLERQGRSFCDGFLQGFNYPYSLSEND